MTILSNLPPQGNGQLSSLRERRKQNAQERRAIQKDLKNETRKQKRVYAQASKCTIEELIGLAAAKAAKASGGVFLILRQRRFAWWQALAVDFFT